MTCCVASQARMQTTRGACVLLCKLQQSWRGQCAITQATFKHPCDPSGLREQGATGCAITQATFKHPCDPSGLREQGATGEILLW